MKLLITLATFIIYNLLPAQQLFSPDKNLALQFSLNAKGEAFYSLKYKNQPVIKASKLGFLISSKTSFAKNFTLEKVQYSSTDKIWHPVWGQESSIRDHHNEMLITLKTPTTDWLLNIRFRLFNDGLGFRYEFPTQPHLRHFRIDKEFTEFNLASDAKAFWIPADYDTNEFPITTSKLSEIQNLIANVRQEPLAAKAPSTTLAVQTPLMLKTDAGFYLNIHEAALVNYPVMHLNVDDKNFVLSAHLTPNRNGELAFMQTQNTTPWRTIIVSDDARDILASRLILNLNEPCKIEDTSWIKPIKYIGVWWEYFTGGGSTWAYSDNHDVIIGKTDYSQLQPNGHHGANTAHVKEYIDFASKNGFDAVLVEGWNEGWEDNWAYGKERVYNFTRAYPDFDVEALHQYAKKKGVQLIMHHETTSAVTDYERHLDEAFAFMKKNGYNYVKTGYVGRIIPRSEYHDSQWMVNHYLHVVKKAAQYKIMVDAHEAARPTGLSRTYPNLLAQESARGTEFESFNGNAPNHTTILPFTRLIGGPMDYTPGIFQGDLSVYGNKTARLSTTLAKQLALYVIMYSPFQMAADLIENYQKHPDAFQFIKDVAVDWDRTFVLEAEPGDYITIARKAKGKEEWFVGSITDENARTATLDFSFLPKGKSYLATFYEDGPKANYLKSIVDYKITQKVITSETKLKRSLKPSGGIAISIRVK